MSSLSFRQRLTIQWTLSFGVLLALVAGAVYVGARVYLRTDLEAQLRTLASTEIASSFDEGGKIHLHDFPLPPIEALQYTDKFVQILSPDGTVMLQSSWLEQETPLLAAPARARVLRDEVPIVPITIEGRPGQMTAMVARRPGEAYIVIVGVFTERLHATLRRLGWLLGIAWLSGLTLTGVIGFVLSSRVLAPVGAITRQAAAIARGDVTARLDPPVFDDEIGQMTVLLNEMLDRLCNAIEVNRNFAADASHELRGPLTAIRGEVDISLRRQREPAEYRETLEVVGHQAGELTELIENLTLLVRARDGNAEAAISEVALVPLIRASARRVGRLEPWEDVRLGFDAFPDLVAYANEVLLAHVFDNLLRNAVQYNKRGGVVWVSGALEASRDSEWSASTAIIRIRDTGAGIPQEDWERVFERFYRVDRSRSRRTGGTGLGLPICREVLAVFRGTVRVAESSADGTVLEVRLPGTLVSDQTTTGLLLDEVSRPAAV